MANGIHTHLIVSFAMACGCHSACGQSLNISKPTLSQPYRIIAKRNAFGLHEAPVPVATPLPRVQPVVDIWLTGIVTVSGVKKAYLKYQQNNQPPFKYLVLKEGEQANQIQILPGGINAFEGQVKILEAGVPLTLSFANKGAQTTSRIGGPTLEAGYSDRRGIARGSTRTIPRRLYR